MKPGRPAVKPGLIASCVVGAAVLAGLAHSGLFFPPNGWATLGAGALGAWLGLAVYRLVADPFE